MPKIVFLPNAGRNLAKLREFLAIHNNDAATKAACLILETTNRLKNHPFLGRPCDDLPEYRDLIIPFGSAGYVLRYRVEGETVFIVAIKHTREVGFSGQE